MAYANFLWRNRHIGGPNVWCNNHAMSWWDVIGSWMIIAQKSKHFILFHQVQTSTLNAKRSIYFTFILFHVTCADCLRWVGQFPSISLYPFYRREPLGDKWLWQVFTDRCHSDTANGQSKKVAVSQSVRSKKNPENPLMCCTEHHFPTRTVNFVQRRRHLNITYAESTCASTINTVNYTVT